MNYHVTCNTDDKYMQHCCAMLCSLFENSSAHIILHVLTVELSQANRQIIIDLAKRYDNECEFHYVDSKILANAQYRENVPLSASAYCRILLASLISDDVDRILYLDCDIIVLRDIVELFEIEIDQYALAACKDTMPYTPLHRKQLQMDVADCSFCSGVMMVNLKYWREINAQDKLLAYSCKKRGHVYCHDQDSLNYFFKRDWLMLPPKWNKAPMSYLPDKSNLKRFDIEEYVYEPCIMHYSAWPKPWFDVWFPNRHYYRKYLDLSGFDNPVFTHIAIKDRILYSLKNARFFLSNYVMPYIPKIFLLLCKDIYNIVMVIFSMISKNRMKQLHLDNCINKYL